MRQIHDSCAEVLQCECELSFEMRMSHELFNFLCAVSGNE